MTKQQQLLMREQAKIDHEIRQFGRPLSVATGESQRFWKFVRKQLGIRWYEFWRDEVVEFRRS